MTTKRLTGIDALRGVALLMMVIYHAAFDVDYLGILAMDMTHGAWGVWRRITQFLFLGLVGVSVELSRRGFGGQLKRGAFIFALGMGVTLATWLTVGDGFIKFGVLHFIGVAVPVVVLFKGRPWSAVALALVCLGVGAEFSQKVVENAWLFPVGLKTGHFYSLDYFPIFPWLAVPLLGLALVEWFPLKPEPRGLELLGRVKPLVAMGRHTLLVYLLHQPILYYALMLVFSVRS